MTIRAWLFLWFVDLSVDAWTSVSTNRPIRGTSSLSAAKLSSLPANISPFVPSDAVSVQREIRAVATKAFREAVQNREESGTLLEFEFPPLLGGKSQFDDFDNVQELDANRDWCVEWISAGGCGNSIDSVWLVLPDVKECELATQAWTGQRYRQAMKFTCIESVAEHYGESQDSGEEAYSKPWGATIANMVNGLFSGGDDDDDDNPRGRSRGLLGDKSSLDDLTTAPAQLHVVAQPGNGGPVEDWINVAAFHERCQSNGEPDTPLTLIVNGALDKVRDGYYAPVFFPKLAATMPFYKSATSVLYLKPVSDKGVYGWLYRVYPEPWQVVLQQVINKGGRSSVVDHVALVSDSRPSYQECVQALLQKANSLQVSK